MVNETLLVVIKKRGDLRLIQVPKRNPMLPQPTAQPCNQVDFKPAAGVAMVRFNPRAKDLQQPRLSAKRYITLEFFPSSLWQTTPARGSKFG